MRIERNIFNGLTHKNSNFELPPNKAFGLAIAPVFSLKKYKQSLRSLGYKSPNELPKSFDWRKIFKLSPVMNQQGCGSCWAIASTSSYADRWMVAKQKDGLVLDPLPVVVCCTNSNKCGGGFPEHCQDYFADKGGVILNPSKNCIGWDKYCLDNKRCIGKSYSPPGINCNELSSCNGGFKAVVGGMKTCTLVDKNKLSIIDTINSIKTNIKLHGPVVAKFQVFGDFTVSENGLVVQGGKSIKWEKTNGVYINGSYDTHLSSLFKEIAHDSDIDSGDKDKLKILEKGLMPVDSDGSVTGELPSQKSMGFHAVEIVGWDVDPVYGEYWIVKNSWGPEWNDEGYCKFAINNDGKTNANCGIDIPIIIDNQLFGGTVSFLPDVDNSKVDWEGKKFVISQAIIPESSTTKPTSLSTTPESSSTPPTPESGSKKSYVWVLFMLSIIVLIVLIYILYKTILNNNNNV